MTQITPRCCAQAYKCLAFLRNKKDEENAEVAFSESKVKSRHLFVVGILLAITAFLGLCSRDCSLVAVFGCCVTGGFSALSLFSGLILFVVEQVRKRKK